MSLNNISAEDFAGTNTTVVWTLWTWETSNWPSVWFVKHVEKSVLLLKTEPRLVGSVRLHQLGTLMTVVVLVWGSIWIPALSDNQDVWGTAEWIWVDCNRSKVNIRVVAWGLTGGRTVEVPFWEVFWLEFAGCWDAGKGLQKKRVRIVFLTCRTVGGGVGRG